MSRCVRRLEYEDIWVVYCNTNDIVFPYMFTDVTTANRFVKEFDGRTKLSKMFDTNDNPISMETIEEYERKK